MSEGMTDEVGTWQTIAYRMSEGIADKVDTGDLQTIVYSMSEWMTDKADT